MCMTSMTSMANVTGSCHGKLSITGWHWNCSRLVVVECGWHTLSDMTHITQRHITDSQTNIKHTSCNHEYIHRCTHNRVHTHTTTRTHRLAAFRKLDFIAEALGYIYKYVHG